MSASESSLPKPAPCCCLSRTPNVGKLAYGAVVIAVVVLAVTGIGTFALGKAPMTHWVLMLHVGTAPLFAIGLAALAMAWAGRARCDGTAGQVSCATKALFWLIVLSGLVVILSGVVPMTPVFGTHGQHTLYLTHRYSGIVLTVALALHLVSLARTKR